MEWSATLAMITAVLASCIQLALHICLPQTIATASLDPHLPWLPTDYEFKCFAKGHITP